MSPTVQRNLAHYGPRIKQLAEAGRSRTEIAGELKLATCTTDRYAKMLGVRIPRKVNPPGQADTAAEIKKLRDGGATLQEIGNAFGVTRERVRQIMAGYYPDVVFPGVMPARTKACIHCGTAMDFRTKKRYCRPACQHQAVKDNKYSRDLAETIMGFLDEGLTWPQIAWRMETPNLRTHLQRYLPIIFSKAERKKYFRINTRP